MASESAGPSRKLGPDLASDDNSSNDNFLEDVATKRQRLQITQGPDAPEQTVLLKKRGRRSWNTLHSVNVSNEPDFRSELLQNCSTRFYGFWNRRTSRYSVYVNFVLVEYFLSQYTDICICMLQTQSRHLHRPAGICFATTWGHGLKILHIAPEKVLPT